MQNSTVVFQKALFEIINLSFDFFERDSSIVVDINTFEYALSSVLLETSFDECIDEISNKKVKLENLNFISLQVKNKFTIFWNLD
jgi:hypothetical protein